jgi:hypothetical protein
MYIHSVSNSPELPSFSPGWCIIWCIGQKAFFARHSTPPHIFFRLHVGQPVERTGNVQQVRVCVQVRRQGRGRVPHRRLCRPQGHTRAHHLGAESHPQCMHIHHSAAVILIATQSKKLMQIL